MEEQKKYLNVENESGKYEKSLALTSGLLKFDFKKLIYFYPLLIISQLIVHILNIESLKAIITFNILQRIFEIIFLYYFLKRLNDHLKLNLNLENNKTLLFLFGCISWLILNIPYLLLITNTKNPIYIILFWPAFYLYLKTFFFFKPILLTTDKTYTTKEYFLFFFKDNNLSFYNPLRIILAAYVILFFFQSFIGLFDPFQNSYIAEFFRISISGIPPIIFTYLSSAFIFENNNELSSQLLNIKNNSNNFITKNLQTRRIVKILIVSLLVSFGNQVRLLTTAPTFKATINEVNTADNKVDLRVTLTSTDNSLKNLQPLVFRLANADNKILSELPEFKVIEKDSNSQVISLSFKTIEERKARHISSLEDIYLWYAYSKMLKIDFKQ